MHAAFVVAVFSTVSPALQTPAPGAVFNKPPVQCIQSEGGETCGYVCERNFGQTRCTRTPFGRCTSQFGQVVCWDPPPGLIALLGDDVPRPQCIANFGKVACGYHCEAQFGDVKCAQTPYGMCGSQFGKVECFDPPLQSLSLVDGEPPAAQCLANFGQIQCGYGCVGNFGQVRCAQTPLGSCTASHGEVTCIDPPLDGLPIVRRVKPQPVEPVQCVGFKGRQVCGYACRSSAVDANCARTPGGRCVTTSNGRVICEN